MFFVNLTIESVSGSSPIKARGMTTLPAPWINTLNRFNGLERQTEAPTTD